MKKVFLLHIILLGHLLILSAQNNGLIEPMHIPKEYVEPNGTIVSAENEYEKSATQMWIVYAANSNVATKKNVISNEYFKTIQMNTPFYVVAEDGEFIRLYRYEGLISFDGKKVLPNHIDNDMGWVNKNEVLLWSKSIVVNNKNKVCFRYDAKVNDPTIYYIYNEDVNGKNYLCSVNQFIIPNDEIENKSLINFDSRNTELFGRSDFVNYNQFIESYFKQFEDSTLLSLSYTLDYDKSLYEQSLKQTIVDSFANYYQIKCNDTISITDSVFKELKTLNLIDSVLITYSKNSRDTLVLQKTNPFIISNESEDLHNRFLLMKTVNNQSYIYFPNSFWKPNKNNNQKFVKLFLVEKEQDKIKLLEQSKSVFFTYKEFENLKMELEEFLNLPKDNKKFRKDFFKYLESLYNKKNASLIDLSEIDGTVADLIKDITGVETTSAILNVSIKKIKDKEVISEQKLRELKELIDNKFRLIMELESNNNYYANEGLNKFYFIPKSYLAI